MLLDIHTHQVPTNSEVFAIVNQYPLTVSTNVPFSIGIHPWFVTENDMQLQWRALQKNVSHSNCLAIGECGLDKLSSTPWQLQLQVFQYHIQLSEQLQKPLIIHCVKSFEEILAYHKKVNPQQVWIVHGFRKNAQVAQRLINRGIRLSFGKALLTDTNLQQTFRSIPKGYYFLETDDANISIEVIYQKAREIKGEISISLSEIL